MVPNTGAGDTAIINNGSPVNYVAGGDLILANGGMLQVTNGSFVQTGGNNYFQLNGNGTLLVNGGTFNQGTASSTPFNVTGTGNAFTVSAGTVNLNSSFNLNVGLTYLQSGGTVNVTGAETDFNNTTSTLAGGILNTTLITGVNGGTDYFNISGGTLNLTGAGEQRHLRRRCHPLSQFHHRFDRADHLQQRVHHDLRRAKPHHGRRD